MPALDKLLSHLTADVFYEQSLKRGSGFDFNNYIASTWPLSDDQVLVKIIKPYQFD